MSSNNSQCQSDQSPASYRTFRDLRNNNQAIQFECSNCTNNGMFDLKYNLISNDVDIECLGQLLCEKCHSGYLKCRLTYQHNDFSDSEKPKRKFETDPATNAWQISHYDLIGRLAEKAFSKNEIIQFSRLDTVGLFYAIENIIKKKEISEISDEEARQLRKSIVWFREFEANSEPSRKQQN